VIPEIDLATTLPPGLVPTREIVDAIMLAWAANRYQPLSAAQVLAITGPAPVYPASLPRLSGQDVM